MLYVLLAGAEQPPNFQNPKFHYVFESVYAYAHALDKCFQEYSGSCNVSSEQFAAYLKAEINKKSNEAYKVLIFKRILAFLILKRH